MSYTSNIHTPANRAVSFANERSSHAYVESETRCSDLHTYLNRHVFCPTREQIELYRDRILDYTRSGAVKVLIPLRELHRSGDSIIHEILSTLAEQVGPSNIFIVDNGIHPTIKTTIHSTKTTLIDAARTRASFNWQHMLDILNLKELTFGKGYAALLGLGHLALEGLVRDEDWIVQCDGDIRDFRTFDLIPHLFYPTVVSPNEPWDHLKIAQTGRNNETVMAGVNALTAFFNNRVTSSRHLSDSSKGAAREIYEACINHVWLLSGQFALKWKHCYRRMAATGYCDEILANIQLGRNVLGQTINPNPCRDIPNDKCKEDCMMTRILQFINALVIHGRSLQIPWSTIQISCFNQDMMSFLNSVVRIPGHGRSLVLESIEADRIMPSVETCIKEQLIV